MQMRKIMLGLVLAPMALGTFASSRAEAREVYHGFVKDEYYLIRGGTPATFEQVASEPLKVFRSQLAYDNFRAHIGAVIGRPVSDSDFRSLMRSNEVRLVPCIGTVDTSGVTDSGKFGWHRRGCYRNEMLIEVRLSDGRWLKVGSQGCYNPVRGEVPFLPPPPPAPPAPPVQAPPPRQTTILWQTPGIVIGGTVIGVENCEGQTIIGTPTIIIPGSVSQTTTFGF